MQDNTIAAISTPSGEGAIGVVRISGSNAFLVAEKVFKSFSGKTVAEIKGYTALYGEVFDSESKIDNAVLLKFCAPKSYTGEDVVELSVHGGSFVVNRVLRACLDNGAFPAGAGEFTKRAFLNGKLDLIEAESVMSLIKAGNDQQLKMANSAISGKISRQIKEIEELLVSLASKIAVFSDYPEEYLPEVDDTKFICDLKTAKEKLTVLIDTYDTGRKIKEGITTAIVGKPNVGKSTLMNLLSGETKSIVTSVAGTTRDVIEDTVNIGNIMLRIADTAGIHETDDEVENIGVKLSRQRIENSDIILAVFDTSTPFDEDDKKLLEYVADKKVLAILNKNDKKAYEYKEFLKDVPFVEMSAKNDVGTEELAKEIEKQVGTYGFDANSAVLFSVRQRNAATNARRAVTEAIEAIENGFTTDAFGICVDDALYALYTLTGQRVTNAVADEVFRNFCVGK